MTPNDRDAEAVRQALSELRGHDARQAPPFDELLARPRRPEPRPVPLARLALAASLLIAAVFAYRAATSRVPRLTLPSEVAALSTWRPVTDVLLENHAAGLLRSSSPLAESIINVNTQGALR